MIGIIYKSNYNNTVYINPTIAIKDSTDLEQLSRISESEIKYTITESIEKIISKEFDRTINYLNFTIVLFAVFLTLILVVFGFFTIKNMAEAKKLLDEIMAAPDIMMKKYYDNQLNELIPNLISSRPNIKSDTIQKLYSNTQLVKEKHYDLISKILVEELENISSYTTMNVMNLFDILCRLEYQKTIDLGYSLLEKHFEQRCMEFLIPLLLESQYPNHKEKFLNYICDSSKPLLTNKIIQNIENYDVFTNESMNHIANNAPNNVTFRILNTIVQKKKGYLDLLPIFLNMNEKTLDQQIFHQILNLLKKNDQFEIRNISTLLNKINKSNLTLDQFLNIVRTLNSYVINDDHLAEVISSIKIQFLDNFDNKEVYKILQKEKLFRVSSLFK